MLCYAYIHCLAPLFFVQKFPAIYSVLCIPTQLLVITTAEAIGNCFLLDNPQVICCMVFDEGIFVFS